MVIYNAKAQQKLLTILLYGAFELPLIFGFLGGKIYNDPKETLIVVLIMLGILLLGFITYFMLIKFANYVFIFNETGFIRKKNKKVLLVVTWDNVISIGTYKIYDFLKFDIGPTFLGIDYFDQNHNQQSLNVAFSTKDAIRLKTSHLNKKLDYIL